jgi:hypothetical protein
MPQAIDEMDEMVKEIRSTIFVLQSRDRESEAGLRAQVVALAGAHSDQLGFNPALRFDGPIDTLVRPPVVDHVLGVLREALSNVVRHAQAHRVEIGLGVGAGQVRLVMADDGVSIAAGGRRRPAQPRKAGSCISSLPPRPVAPGCPGAFPCPGRPSSGEGTTGWRDQRSGRDCLNSVASTAACTRRSMPSLASSPET